MRRVRAGHKCDPPNAACPTPWSTTMNFPNVGGAGSSRTTKISSAASRASSFVLGVVFVACAGADPGADDSGVADDGVGGSALGGSAGSVQTGGVAGSLPTGGAPAGGIGPTGGFAGTGFGGSGVG